MQLLPPCLAYLRTRWPSNPTLCSHKLRQIFRKRPLRSIRRQSWNRPRSRKSKAERKCSPDRTTHGFIWKAQLSGAELGFRRMAERVEQRLALVRTFKTGRLAQLSRFPLLIG